MFDEVEVLDMAGPFEVFSVAARLSARGGGMPRFRVATIAPAPGPIAARGGVTVLPSHDFATAPPLDLLVVAGGVGSGVLSRPESLAWIREAAGSAALTASVCTWAFLPAFLLAKSPRQVSGPRPGFWARAVTAHWEDADDLAAAYPALDIKPGPLWVDSGEIVTSAGILAGIVAGISAGIEMSLHLVRRLAGGALAKGTARQTGYDWRDRWLDSRPR